jgi:hypothetical protein
VVALHKEIMRAIQENPEATDAQVAKIVNCARHTVERHRTAEREHKQADYFERYPPHLKPPRHD